MSARGQLRIYLGAAPGVGKTYAMLQEGVRRSERGTDVVIGYVETHGRVNTEAQRGTLEVIPPRMIGYRGAVLAEMDVDAVLARAPQVVLVDELAHTNVPGSRNEKRWQDVQELLDAGIDVISTVNIQHLESLNDVVEKITGVTQREIIPDAMVRAADQVQLVDQTPEALRRRMAHGNVYPAERVDAALGNYFRVGNLTALRELALMWVADQVDESLQSYRERHGIDRQWETRERVVVAVTGAPNGEHLIRRAARIAARARGELLGVHIRTNDGLSGDGDGALAEHRALLIALGGHYHEVAGADVAPALVRFARAENATQIVLGATRRSRWEEIARGSVINDVTRLSGSIDVHVVSSEDAASAPVALSAIPAPVGLREVLPRRRQISGYVLAVVGSPVVTLVLSRLDSRIGLTTELLAYLLFVVVVASTGGLYPASIAAIGSFLLVNWFFTPPEHTFTIAESENLFGLFAFLVVAVSVGWLVSAAARRSAEAARARSEAATLVSLAGAASTADDPIDAILQQLRDVFGASGVSLLAPVDGGRYVTEASAGDEPPPSPAGTARAVTLPDGAVLAVGTGSLRPIDDDVLAAFTSQLVAARERRALRDEAFRSYQVGQVSELRAALLAAVSHDLRTPLSSIKAAVTSLQADVDWSPDDRAEFLAAIDDQTDRLTSLITNLLGMSRIQAGVVELAVRPVGYDEVVGRALVGIDHRGRTFEVEVDEHLPPVAADPALLERVVANLLDNAAKWSPVDQPVRISAAAGPATVTLAVSDRGPGVPRQSRTAVFEPFQRLDDSSGVEGTGLGLAVARGFCELMRGSLEIDDTPGGGATLVLTLPRASTQEPS